MAAAADASLFPPPELPEIAFLGRSNVGKSSVINSLLAARVAKTSSSPGRTRSINFFEVRWPGRPRPELVFTDLPGYGYAKISREISQDWPRFIDPYLKERPNLVLCLSLVDANIAVQPADLQLHEWLRTAGRPFVIIATKCDRLSGNQLTNALHKFAEQFGGARIVPYSAKTGAGRDELWKEIRAAAQPPLLETQIRTGS